MITDLTRPLSENRTDPEAPYQASHGQTVVSFYNEVAEHPEYGPKIAAMLHELADRITARLSRLAESH